MSRLRAAPGALSSPNAGLGWALALLAFAQLIIALDLNIVFVALPEIGDALGFSDQSLQWVISAYVVFCGGFLLLGGRAADLLGRRRMFVLALGLYAVSSLAGGLAESPGVIVAARAVQGVGGALLFPATLSLVNTLFAEGRPRNRALAVWGGAGASGLTIGALLGGILTDAFGWSAVFFVNVPLAAIVAIAALAVLPADPPRTAERRFDLPGAVTVTAGAMLLVFALVQGPTSGWGSPLILASAAASVLLLALFVRVEQRSPDPLMPLRMLRNRSLVAGMAITAIFMGTFGALPYFLTVLLHDVLGLSALQTGLAFLVPAIATAAGTQLGEQLIHRLQIRTTLLLGISVGAGGIGLTLFGFSADSSYGTLVPGLVVFGLGQGVTWTAMWIAAASGVDHHEQGVASGMAATTQNIGNAIGLAVLIAIANAGVGDATGPAHAAAVADGARTAVAIAAAGLLLGLVVALGLPRRGASATTSAGLGDPELDVGRVG